MKKRLGWIVRLGRERGKGLYLCYAMLKPYGKVDRDFDSKTKLVFASRWQAEQAMKGSRRKYRIISYVRVHPVWKLLQC